MKYARSLMIFAFVTSPFAEAQQDAALSRITMPEGFSIEVYADDVDNARSLTLGDEGTVFVSTRRDGSVYALVPRRRGVPRRIVLAEDLKTPNGIAAEHGSWNRSKKIGYRITLVRLEGGKAVSYEPFAEGWLHPLSHYVRGARGRHRSPPGAVTIDRPGGGRPSGNHWE